MITIIKITEPTAWKEVIIVTLFNDKISSAVRVSLVVDSKLTAQVITPTNARVITNIIQVDTVRIYFFKL